LDVLADRLAASCDAISIFVPENSLTLPVKYLVKRPPVFVEPDATVAQAARTMREALIGSVLVADDPEGIVTDRDLSSRVLAAGLGPETSVRQIMNRPLKTLDSDAPVFAALHLMLEENIHHLALVEEGRIVGLISSSDLLQHQASSPLYLRRTLETLEAPARLAHYSREVAGMVETLFRGGLGAVQIGRIVSSVNDALIKRLVGLAERDLGPAPTAFAWIVFGSEGRLEQALLTDQDNALIYGEESETAHVYFAALAERVVDGLIQTGFPPCAGGFMATHWCKSLEEWRRLFARWVRTPEPQALLDAAIFFDFRPVAGALSLASLDKILAGAKTEKAFIAHLAEGALVHPPLGFFNRIRSDNGRVDVKKSGLAPIVALARAAALAGGSLERSTLERLAAAGKSGAILGQDDASELAEIFQFLLHLRLRQQLAALQANRPLDHNVHLNALSTLERRHLKEAFVMIRRIQDGIRAWCSWEIVGW
jgi:CBS domain-containing protein